MTSGPISAQAAAVSQPVSAPVTRAAIFLVVTINPGNEHRTTVLSLCSDLGALLRAVGFREPEGLLSCIMGFGSDVWNRLFGEPRPTELHPFQEIRSRHVMQSPRPAISGMRNSLSSTQGHFAGTYLD